MLYISSVSEAQTLYGKKTAAKVWAKVELPTGVVLSRVWAEIFAPDSEVSIFDLSDPDNDFIYEGIYTRFTQQGDYLIYFYADNVISEKFSAVFRREPEADDYEPDDLFTQASPIILNAQMPQQHDFHDYRDADWMKIYGLSGDAYSVEVNNLNILSNAVIEIYAPDGTTKINESVNSAANTGKSFSLDWNCLRDGVYYLKISNYDPSVFGIDAQYDIQIYRPCPCPSGSVFGRVTDTFSGKPLKNVLIKTDHGGSAISDSDGNYELISYWTGSNLLIAERDGYERSEYPVTISESQAGLQNIGMSLAKGNINGDARVDLADAISVLQIVSGKVNFSWILYQQADVNGDGRIGMEEVIYILQKVAGLR